MRPYCARLIRILDLNSQIYPEQLENGSSLNIRFIRSSPYQ